VGRVLSWTLVCLAVIIVPVSLMIYKLHWKDPDVRSRTARRPLYLLGIIMLALCTSGVILLRGPRFLALLLVAATLAGVLGMVANERTKLSVHSGTMAGATVAYMAIHLWAGFGMALLTLLVCWSRIHARKHTSGQVFWGAVGGMGCMLATLLLEYLLW